MLKHNEHIVGEDALEINEEDLEVNLPMVTNEHGAEVLEVEKEAMITPLSPLELQLATEKLNNIAPKAIAKRLGVSDKVVRIVLARPHVKKYIKDVFDAVTSADKTHRMQLMAAMIENKMEEEGINSKLDLAQLIQILDGMGKVAETAEVGGQGSVMVNILNQIKK